MDIPISKLKVQQSAFQLAKAEYLWKGSKCLKIEGAKKRYYRVLQLASIIFEIFFDFFIPLISKFHETESMREGNSDDSKIKLE